MAKPADPAAAMAIREAQQPSLDTMLQALDQRGLAARPETLNDLGTFLAGRGRGDDAVACYHRALVLRPDYALALNNLGLALRGLRRVDEAVAAHRRAVAIDPGYADGHDGLAAALARAGQADAAIDHYRHALSLAPDHVEALVNLGNLWRDAGRVDDALALQRRAAALRPRDTEVLNNLGITLRERNEVAEAIDCFRRAVTAQPSHVGAHVNLGMALLAAGDFAAGCAEYEWRRRWERRAEGRAAPLWDGRPLGPRTLLLWSEQGLGDTIQFIRYAKLLRRRAGRILLACPPPLARLMRSARGLDAVIPIGDALPPVDAYLPLLSAMHRLGASLGTIPTEVPYLAAEPGRVAALAPVLAGERPRVGLVWSGNPDHPNDRRRSIPLRLLRPLLEFRGPRFVSLQTGPRAADLADAAMAGRILDLGPHLLDFADTAAALTRLDLVIAVDTAVAHLAGALGRPCWLLLPFSADWRWLMEREDSPWYPSLRLFRQPRPGAWEPVVAAVARELAPWAGEELKVRGTAAAQEAG